MVATSHTRLPTTSTGRGSVNRGGISGTGDSGGSGVTPTTIAAGTSRAPQRCPVSFCSVREPSEIRALAGDLSLAVVRLTRHLRGRRPDAQISLTQLSALATLATDGAMTPGALAAKERVQPPSMTRVIASLSEMRLVNRDPHPTDGRQVIVSLAEAGQALLRNETSAREEWMSDQLSGLSPEQLRTLADAVTIMRQLVAEPE